MLRNSSRSTPDGAENNFRLPADDNKQKKGQSLKRTLLPPSSVLTVAEPPSSSTSKILITEYGFFDSLITKVRKRKTADENAVVLYVPDNLLL